MTAGEERLRLRLVAAGRVQGVGFRRFVQRCALGHDLAGWVANRADGSVEILAEGAREAVDALRADVRRGPPGARVADLRAETASIDEELPHPFEIRHG